MSALDDALASLKTNKPSTSNEKTENSSSSSTTTSAPPSSSSPQPNPPRIVNRRSRNLRGNVIPPEILSDPEIAKALSSLPSAYSFEIHKTIWRLRTASAKFVALQMPEGLLMYGCVLTDIFKTFGGADDVVLLGDVTYGACCVDDLGARALGCDFLVHYGHSCLVPLTSTVLPCLYVFVEIKVDTAHLVACVAKTLEAGTRISVMGTVQFRQAVFDAKLELEKLDFTTIIPQAKPLSPGEVLGCTAPNGLYDDGDNLKNAQCMLFIADGRFHLEAAMIANPKLKAYRYDPYGKVLTEEGYEFKKMKGLRKSAIDNVQDAKTFGIILGTLGRQGNPAILSRVKKLLTKYDKRSFVVLLSEIFPAQLDAMGKGVDAWVQIACPRLSVDWGHFFTKSVLSPYELEVALGTAVWEKDSYPMDFYSKTKEGDNLWSNFGGENNARIFST